MFLQNQAVSSCLIFSTKRRTKIFVISNANSTGTDLIFKTFPKNIHLFFYIVFSLCRKKGPGGLTELDVMNKNPVSLLNELRGSLDYACVSSWGSGTHQLFTMGVTIDGVSYTGTASNKKVAVTSIVDLLWFPCGSGSVCLSSQCGSGSREPNECVSGSGSWSDFKVTKISNFYVMKSLDHLKNLKTGRIPYLGLELTMHVLKSQIRLLRQSP